MPDRTRRLNAVVLAAVLVFALAGAALAISACGGDEGSGEDIDKVLDETFGGKRQIDSGKLDMSLRADLEGAEQLSGPVSVRIRGPFESRGDKQVPELDLDMRASAGGQSVRAGVISTGKEGYISLQGTDYKLTESQFRSFERDFRTSRGDANEPDLARLGIDPRGWLEDPTDEGTEEVDGAETIHISSDVDVKKFLEDVDDVLARTEEFDLSRQQRQQLPDSLPSSTKKQIIDAVDEAKFDLYTDKDKKILRKMEVELSFDVPEDARKDASGLESGKVEFSVEVTDLNEPQEVEKPKNARPFSEFERQINAASQLGALGGSLGGSQGGSQGGGTSGGSSGGGSGGSGSTSPGTGTTSPGTGGGSSPGTGGGAGRVDPQKARRYLRCVEGAKQPEEIAKCSQLLR